MYIGTMHMGATCISMLITRSGAYVRVHHTMLGGVSQLPLTGRDHDLEPIEWITRVDMRDRKGTGGRCQVGFATAVQ